nr:hypothetical protein [Tanacetum cinerariifolium]
MHLLRENLEKQVVVWKKPPSYTEGEPIQTENAKKEPAEHLELFQYQLLKLKSLDHHLVQVIDITPPEQLETLPVAPKSNREKDIAIDDIELPKKLVKALTVVRPDHDEPVRVLYGIHGKFYHLTNDEIQEHLDKEEKIRKAVKEATLLEMCKPELIKIVQEEATKARVEPKIIASAKGGQEFKKIQDVEMKVLSREHAQKILTSPSLTSASELIKIIQEEATKARVEPKIIASAKGGQEFKKIQDVEMKVLSREHAQKKKNKIVSELMISLGKRYERLKKIPEELGIQSALPAPKQAPSQLSGRKRKKMELEPEICIPTLECNISLLEGISFVNNMVIEEPRYGMFFIDVFGDEAYQRMSDIYKVGVKTLPTYLVMASNITTPKNTRFYLKLRKLIEDHPDHEKLKSKRVKLESVGYKL